MAKKIAASTLNASTLDILNVIRQNASPEYQASVPKITKTEDIKVVGEIICGEPAFANQFVNALVNRIALVRAKSATFNNPYAHLKKGYLDFGETIEDIFVNIAKVQVFDTEKGEEREFKRNLPDVRAAFYVMNWRVMYPATVENENLRMAFLSVDGVSDLIQRIVDAIYTGAEYDEFLLFKYLLIKSIAKGKMYPVSIGDGTDMKDAASAFRGMSNLLPFMKKEYNAYGVLTTTPKERQCIFMDAKYNADYDVNVLASAFNMDKADFMGRLHLIDDWTTFDNERWEEIRKESTNIEAVTDEELALMADVKAVLIDEDWFQVYDNLLTFREREVGSGLYWNYWLHSWKTIACSPFANAVVFVTSDATISEPASLTAKIATKDVADAATVLTVQIADSTSLQNSNYEFVQTEALTEAGIGVQKYGAILIPASKVAEEITLVVKHVPTGTLYTASTAITGASDVDDTVTLAKE